MNEAYTQLDLVNNEAAQRFEMTFGDYTAVVEYELTPGTMKLVHTEVPPELEGKGAASAIIERTLEYVENRHLKLIPFCPFVFTYLKRHPEWNRLI